MPAQCHRPPMQSQGRPLRQRGSALIEYTIVVLFLVVVLLANPNVIAELANAVRDAYTSFVYALSISWI